MAWYSGRNSFAGRLRYSFIWDWDKEVSKASYLVGGMGVGVSGLARETIWRVAFDRGLRLMTNTVRRIKDGIMMAAQANKCLAGNLLLAISSFEYKRRRRRWQLQS